MSPGKEITDWKEGRTYTRKSVPQLNLVPDSKAWLSGMGLDLKERQEVDPKGGGSREKMGR